jgi:hypothetical protein
VILGAESIILTEALCDSSRKYWDSRIKRASNVHCRSQWLRGLRHGPSSSARTLGSWVRIPLMACMSVCVYTVFLLSCV